MSILIKGMEMPDACDECACSILIDGYSMPFCAITSKDICRNDFHTRRRDDCPLVPVPKHGRLIDGDLLPWILANKDVDYASYEDWEKLCDVIRDAPTIIPADPAKGET